MNEPAPERARPDGAALDGAALDQDALELAALYALSALSPAETEAVERDQRARAAFWAEVRSLRDAAAGLAEAGPRTRPRRDLWPEIRARLAPPPAAEAPAAARPVQVWKAVQVRKAVQVWKAWRAEDSAHTLVPGSKAADFEPTGFPGVHVRRLAVDEDADRVTMLIRMEPGTSYPAHVHGGAEECFVLEGDLEIGAELEMRAGDFQRMERGSRHPVQSTRGGCLLLLTSSRHDELLA
jgi:quercetin dioxygenase-like cupin family protein